MKYRSDEYDPNRYKKPDARTKDEILAVVSSAAILAEAKELVARCARRGWVRFPVAAVKPEVLT